MSVVVETTKGIFTVDLYVKQRPKACKNFLKLCKVKFYNYSLFHTVQANFLAQTGDPTGVGKNGGESIYRRLYGDQATFFEGDLLPKMKHNKRGILSMVTVGDNLYGSQFFITLGDNLEYLDASHCIFGEIVEGLDEIVDMFNETICDDENKPYQDIRITHTVVLHDPFDDPPGLELPDQSPGPPEEMLRSTRIAADEDINGFEGMTEMEVVEMMAEKEAKAQATILEMIGDLPEADCAPPENVLFVCKLNPVTTDDDLEIIFSRFGKVKSCEVIRDHKTQDSLQYAFIEFEDTKACEAAYFKMDNVLIDDRRIHVDFSQSVSKFRWKGKGRLEVFEDKPDPKNQRSKPDEKKQQFENKNRGFDRERQQSRDDPRNRKSYNGTDRNSKPAFERNYRNDKSRDYDEKSRERRRDKSSERFSMNEKQRDRHTDDSERSQSKSYRQKDRHRHDSEEKTSKKERYRRHSPERSSKYEKQSERRRHDSDDRNSKNKSRHDSRDRGRQRDRSREPKRDRKSKHRSRSYSSSPDRDLSSKKKMKKSRSRSSSPYRKSKSYR